MNETQTRGEHVDPALKAAGWGVVEGSKILREYPITPGRIEGHGRRGRALTADYVLIYRNRKLAVVEAKAWDKPLTEGVAQAKDYAAKMAVRFGYATNGQGVYAIDMQTAKEGERQGYPTPDELWNLTFAEANAWRDRFADVPFEDKGGTLGERYFRDIAIERVLDAIADDQPRILLTLATGTGKTLIAFQIAWKLFQSRWNLSREPTRRPRILFLADRNILANQACNAFSAFPEDALVRIEPEDIRKKGRVPKNGNLFFTIFQTFMSGPPKDGKPSPYFGDYPPDFFDFIVIDECHRGGANDESNWRGILDYFAPAVQLGLTATPKRRDNVDTYAYFGEPVYIYSLKDGINDGFLTPFKVKQISTTLDEYVYTSDDTVVEGEVEAGKRYTEPDFNKNIEIRERERKRVEIFMGQINQNEKTLVFCATQAHALAVRDFINQLKTSTDPNYCQRVTADDGALGELTSLRTTAVIEALKSVAPGSLEWHANDEIFGLAFQRADVPVADVVHWYHVSRTWPDFQFDEGILPLAQAEPELWRRLGELASDWVDAAWWQQFKKNIGHEGNSADHNYIGRRSGHVSWGGGPYAFLIREVIGELSDTPYHYVLASETVTDICASFQARTGKDLLAKFSDATEAVIVKFRHPSQHGTELLDAVNYAYHRVHGLELNREVTPCFSGEGVPVPRSAIVAIERLGDRRG